MNLAVGGVRPSELSSECALDWRLLLLYLLNACDWDLDTSPPPGLVLVGGVIDLDLDILLPAPPDVKRDACSPPGLGVADLDLDTRLTPPNLGLVGVRDRMRLLTRLPPPGLCLVGGVTDIDNLDTRLPLPGLPLLVGGVADLDLDTAR